MENTINSIETNGGFTALKFGKTHPDMYKKLTSEHPVDI